MIIKEGARQPGIASISKTSGDAIPTDNTSKKLYPQKAFKEAMELTAGLPYKKLGKAQLDGAGVAEEKVPDEPVAEEVVVGSAEYQKIVDKYTEMKNCGK